MELINSCLKDLTLNIGSLAIWCQVFIFDPVVFYFCPLFSTLISDLHDGMVIEVALGTD